MSAVDQGAEEATTSTSICFNYSVVTADKASALRSHAERIRARIARSTADMLATGGDLLAAKAHLKHGEFTLWVEAELGITVRSAQTMMRAAEIAAESEKFSLLPPSVALRLSAPSVPSEVRETLVERAAKGERVPVAAVATELQRVRDEREKAKQAEELAKLSPRSRKTREERARKAEEQRAAYQREREEKERRGIFGAAELAKILYACLGPEQWRRVRALLGDDEVVSAVYRSGVRRYRTQEAMDALGNPSSSVSGDVEHPPPATTSDVVDDFEPPAFLQKDWDNTAARDHRAA